MANFTAGAVLTASALNTAFNTATINAQTTAYTIGTADAGELVTVNNNSGGTVTIPANTTWGAATGTIVSVLNAGTAGSWTIGTAAGVTLNASSTTLAALESGQLVKTATNTWYFVKGGGLPKASYSATTGSPTITTVSGKTCVQWTGSGSVTISTAGVVRALAVGGGGFSDYGGSTYYYKGGAGGMVELDSLYLPTGTHTITVGAGGAISSRKASDSVIGTFVTAVGGGNGNVASGAAYAYWGQDGGSGSGYGTLMSTEGVTNQGNAGGSGNGGAGGGAGGAASGTTPGAGKANDITGSSVTYATGGGGSTANTANSGNGRGGGSGQGNGNSGVVILLFG